MLKLTLLCFIIFGTVLSRTSRRIALKPEEINMFLEKHNIYRSQLASGEISPYPSASNMKEMIWDSELAAHAQQWADHHVLDYESPQKRKTSAFASYGQTTFLKVQSYFFMEAPLAEAVDAWFREKVYTKEKDLEHYKLNYDNRDFIQMMWADSYALGCGYSLWNQDDGSFCLVVCNYAPEGMLVGQKAYEEGEPGSKCAKPSLTYLNLCKPEVDTIRRKVSRLRHHHH